MQPYAHFDLTELKVIYRVLHKQLLMEPALMDGDFLSGLQSWLQGIAAQQGVDVGDHSAWDAWLHR